VLTRVLALDTKAGDPLAGRLDRDHVAAAGHSGGGVTTIGMLSGTRDDRLSAAVVLAGRQALPGTFTGAAVPVLFVHGQLDQVVRYAAGVAAFKAVPWPKALLTLPQADRALDAQAVEDFFTYGYVPDPKTIYRSIRKLPAGHYLLARRGRPPEIRRYWSLLETAPASGTVTPELLVETLAAAVKRRLVSDVPLGALLSGGVDSSAVVALMALQAGRPIDTFSIAFGDRDFDETSYARAVAERYATHHDVRRVSADDFEMMRRLPEIHDEPFGDVSAIPTFAVCAQARRSVTVAMSGDGGDEALAGYRRHAFHCVGERVRAHVAPSVRARLLGPLADIYPRGAWLPRPLRAKTTLRELSMDSASAYARMSSALPEEARAALLTTDFRKALGGYDAGDVVLLVAKLMRFAHGGEQRLIVGTKLGHHVQRRCRVGDFAHHQLVD